MTRMRPMSVRLGISSPPRPHAELLDRGRALTRRGSNNSGRRGFEELDEAVEQVGRVVRAGRRLRVVLHAERPDVAGDQALDHVVVEAHVAYFDGAELGLDGSIERRVDREPVVVRGDLDLAGA